MTRPLSHWGNAAGAIGTAAGWIKRVGLDAATKRSPHPLGNRLKFADRLLHILHIIPICLSKTPHINIRVGQVGRIRRGRAVGMKR